MRRLKERSCFAILFTALLSACSNTATTPAAPLRIQYTLAAQPWLVEVEACAGERTVLPELSAPGFQDLSHVDMAIRIGEESLPASSAYQVGNDEIVVILNPENSLAELTVQEVSDLFSGEIQDWQELGGSTAAVQAWVFSSGDEVQSLFEGTTLSGLPVTSKARLATSPEAMFTAISEDVNAVGILSRRWMTDGIKAVFTAGEFPVLVLLPDEPGTGMEEIVACMQNQDK